MKEYKPIILSLIKFFAVYIVLIAIYYLYLNYYQDILKTCDPFTEVVAKQSSLLLNLVGFPSETHHFNQENYMHFSINNKYISGVNEGCNAISVIILFLSFVIAFSSGKIKTLLYILVTLPIIHFANIIRIAFINYVFYYYPQYGKDVHDYIFPAIIYGLIIILWIIWIKYFVFVKNEK
ncbi:exosortase family protein XrtF [Apibacter raozihei]|uniref:exosortase family protein XrtF n=1 Tax=Apibacter TaxID=1778601 RepID=UPI000FE38286|nr:MULTISPECIES: exosortase family protein XrtF [Apibacter]